MKLFITTILLLFISLNPAYSQQMGAAKYNISVDVGHGQIFWGDPSDTQGMESGRADRVRYLASQLQSNASSLDAGLVFLQDEITSADLSDSDLLFIHMPSSRYTETEIGAITGFLEEGGSLFLVMDVDGWSSLDQANVNDIIRRYGIQYGPDSPDTEVGAMTREGVITSQAVKIPYHGGRVVNGGTPFTFAGTIAFGTFAALDSGGKIIVMGDGMTSLYMNSWQGVDDYQTEEFMHDTLKWLLE